MGEVPLHEGRMRDPGAMRGFRETHVFCSCPVGGGVRVHPENARMSGRHRVQDVEQCVACAALALVVRQ